MNFFKSLGRISILLFVAVLCVFIYFNPEDLATIEEVKGMVNHERIEAALLNQELVSPEGENQDRTHYFLSFIYLLFSIDLFRKNSLLKTTALSIREIEGFKTLEKIGAYKFFVSALFFISASILIFSLYSFYIHLPSIFTHVEWMTMTQNKQWSSGWSLLLCEFSTALFHAGIIRMIMIFRKNSQLKRSNF